MRQPELQAVVAISEDEKHGNDRDGNGETEDENNRESGRGKITIMTISRTCTTVLVKMRMTTPMMATTGPAKSYEYAHCLGSAHQPLWVQ